MIASLLKLSRSDFEKLRINDPYGIHRAVYSLFPKTGDGRDFIFVDKGGNFNERQILILSKRSPEKPDYGTIESKNIPEPFLNQDHYGFEIRLNPTKREKNGGKIVPIMGKENLAEWFCSKSERWGFVTERESLQIQFTGVQTFDKQNGQVTQNVVNFIGKLRVNDRSLFIKSFEQGIGRGKSFGFGLLEIIPLQD
ncbi:type I-E CRISPR-associated protein Cas6/Cse3/CasE [Treponema primitia]|uniref:type I-E CRISPR-associated protein Cas6/Cse3/CasE n=1 Tax=Treponema primitia TaxID=88058 RepID=UPI0039800647